VFLSVDPNLFTEPPLSPSFHPQSLMSADRSLPVGRPRFNRCCDLIIDLGSYLIDGSWARSQAQSPDLGGTSAALVSITSVLPTIQELMLITAVVNKNPEQPRRVL
jgi:hypothetical protein